MKMVLEGVPQNGARFVGCHPGSGPLRQRVFTSKVAARILADTYAANPTATSMLLHSFQTTKDRATEISAVRSAASQSHKSEQIFHLS